MASSLRKRASYSIDISAELASAANGMSLIIISYISLVIIAGTGVTHSDPVAALN